MVHLPSNGQIAASELLFLPLFPAQQLQGLRRPCARPSNLEAVPQSMKSAACRAVSHRERRDTSKEARQEPQQVSLAHAGWNRSSVDTIRPKHGQKEPNWEICQFLNLMWQCPSMMYISNYLLTPEHRLSLCGYACANNPLFINAASPASHSGKHLQVLALRKVTELRCSATHGPDIKSPL